MTFVFVYNTCSTPNSILAGEHKEQFTAKETDTFLLAGGDQNR